jgi:hypothetical protein
LGHCSERQAPSTSSYSDLAGLEAYKRFVTTGATFLTENRSGATLEWEDTEGEKTQQKNFIL